MPVTYIERRRISRNKFIGFTPTRDGALPVGGFRGGQDFTSQAAVGDILPPMVWNSADLTGNQVSSTL